MKLFYFALLLTTAYVSAVDQDLSIDGLGNIFKTKCERKSGPDAFEELHEAVDESNRCLKKIRRSVNTYDLNDFCEGFTNNPETYGCVTPIGEKLRACLDEEESYLPGFLYGAFNHTVNEFCGPAGQAKYDHIRATLQDSTNGFKNIDLHLLGKTCFPHLAIFKSANALDGKSFIVKESEICSDMENFQTCVTNSIKEQSGKDHSLFVQYVLESLLSWCAKHD